MTTILIITLALLLAFFGISYFKTKSKLNTAKLDAVDLTNSLGKASDMVESKSDRIATLINANDALEKTLLDRGKQISYLEKELQSELKEDVPQLKTSIQPVSKLVTKGENIGDLLIDMQNGKTRDVVKDGTVSLTIINGLIAKAWIRKDKKTLPVFIKVRK